MSLITPRTWDTIIGAINSTETAFGGSWANYLSWFLNGVNIELLDPSKVPDINTTTYFRLEKLRLLDIDASHYAVISVEDLDTASKKYILRNLSAGNEDHFLMEKEPASLRSKVINTDAPYNNSIINIRNTHIATNAAIDWTKVSKSGSVLGDLGDINLSGLSNGMSLKWDSATAKWIVFVPGTGGGGSGTGNAAAGSTTRSGNASTKTITIPHGITAFTPTRAFVNPKSSDALGSFTIAVDATNITLTYAVAPPSGTDNLDYFWLVTDSTFSGGSGGGGGSSLLSQMTDVNFTSLANNQLIRYDSATSKWVNMNQSALSIAYSQLTGIPAALVRTDQANTFGAFDQRIPSGRLKISHTGYNASIDVGDDLAGNISWSFPNTSTSFVGIDTPATFTNKTLAGLKGARTTKSAAYTLTSNDTIVLASATSAGFTLTLPPATSSDKQVYFIQKIDNSANAVVVDAHLAETINGVATISLTAQYQSLILWCDGTAWYTQPGTNERTGKAVASGNGTSTVFTIAHGLGQVPYNAMIDVASHNIGRTWTADTTNITITFASAPPSGTNNLVIYWRAVI
jgi:hypothetical protein